MRGAKEKRGAVLIVVMAVLMVLALLATTFASLQGLERQVARNYLDGVRAKQLARAGVEFGYSRLLEGLNAGQLGNPQFLKSLQYFGNDTLEVGTSPALLNVDLGIAMNPSLACEATGGSTSGPLEAPQNPTDANITPRNIWVRHPSSTTPIQVGFSGLMDSGSYGIYGDSFSLNVRDASAMIYVNDGVNESTTYGSVTRNLRRVLKRLGEAPTVGVMNLGDLIINNRPTGGYKTKRELQSILGTTNYQKVSRFITCHAWVDGNVANPVPFSGNAGVLSYYNSWFVAGTTTGTNHLYRGAPTRYRYGWRKNMLNMLVPGSPNNAVSGGSAAPGLAPATGMTHAIYGIDEVFPRWIEMTSRAPINLNSASKEVLMALLADVHGIWVVERLRNNPPSGSDTSGGWWWSGGGGANVGTWNAVGHTYDAGGIDDGDQFGFLVTSDPIKPPATSGPNSASWIADELIACRNKATGPNSGTNYAAMPFGGPFRTWRQFDLFVDHLVDELVVYDTRTDVGTHPYFCYSSSATDAYGNTGGAMASGFQLNMYRRIGSQAIADAIKANFNPNLHLNEINPDENLKRLIDKTDLVVNSTEGTFVPTGHYEIESLGRVVRPQGSPANALNSTSGNPCDLIAEFKVEAVVKLYDAMRFTSQRDFFGYDPAAAGSAVLPTETWSPTNLNYWPAGLMMGGGTVGNRSSLPNTSNCRSIEIGPEPDLGRSPEQNRWSGYIAWPTNYGDMQTPKAPGAMPPGVDDPNETACPTLSGFTNSANIMMHAHWSRSDYLSTHFTGERRNLNRFIVANEQYETYPDQLEPLPGPYDPYRPAPANPIQAPGSQNWHRLARSFRVPTYTGTGSMPNLTAETGSPLDLRIDGLYLERHSTLTYWLNNLMVTGSASYLSVAHQEYRLLYMYWMKPQFYPEMAGKPRSYWSWKKLDPRGDTFAILGKPDHDKAFPLTQYFCGSQNPSVEASAGDTWVGWMAEWAPIRPASMIYLGWAGFASYPGSFCPTQCYAEGMHGAASPTLNHNAHDAAGYATCSHPAATRRYYPGTAGVPFGNVPYYSFRNPFVSGRWMHYAWFSNGNLTQDIGPTGYRPYRRMYINGATNPGHLIKYGQGGGDVETTWPHYHIDWGRHMGSSNQVCGPGYYQPPAGQHQCCMNSNSLYSTDLNLIRIGEADKISNVPGGFASGITPPFTNFSPDCTMDEYYMMARTPDTVAGSDINDSLAIYRKGRYHLPRNPDEGLYVSPRFNLPVGSGTLRALPPPSSVAPPTGSPPAPPPVGGATTPAPKILGVNWTWAGEAMDMLATDPQGNKTLAPTVTDFNTVNSITAVPTFLKPTLECSVFVDSAWYGPYTNEYFSAVQTAGGQAVVVVSPLDLRFRFKFNWGTGSGAAPNLNSYVIATPYIDDITIYYDKGDSGFVDYHMA